MNPIITSKYLLRRVLGMFLGVQISNLRRWPWMSRVWKRVLCKVAIRNIPTKAILHAFPKTPRSLCLLLITQSSYTGHSKNPCWPMYLLKWYWHILCIDFHKMKPCLPSLKPRGQKKRFDVSFLEWSKQTTRGKVPTIIRTKIVKKNKKLGSS